MITDGEQTRLDFNLSFYGHFEGIDLESASPRRFGPPAHDQRGKHRGHRRIARPARTGRRSRNSSDCNGCLPRADSGPATLKASVPGPYTLSGRLLVNKQYPDRWALTEALLPIVRKELEALVGRRLPRDQRG